MADGRVVFEIQGDPKGINTTLKDVTKSIESESKKWDKAAAESADEAENSWTGAVGKIVGALSAAGVATILVNWGKAAISAASDLAEVQNVVDVTFGAGAVKIDSWAKSAGKAFGLTETQAKRYTSTIGAMMKSQGIADDQLLEMSTDLAGLAADMASFYNLDFDEAFQKIRAGISGETEPLKQLGVNMSAANLEAFRLEKGMTKAFSAMSQGEQTALRYQYIMQATADAQGDFARTADGFANATRRVETAMDTIKTVGGGLLMEVVESLTTGLASLLEQLTTKDTTVLDDIAAIDTKTGEKVSKIRQTAEDATLLTDELSKLGDMSKLTGDGQSYWLETCKRLVQTLPGLSAIIDTQTGEVKGGTQAVYDYIKAWEEGQTKLAMLGALQQKEEAVAQRFSDLPGLQLDMAVEQRRARQRMEELQKVYDKYGISVSLDKNGNVRRGDWMNRYGILTAEYEELRSVSEAYDEQNKKARQAAEEYQKQADALDEAKEALKDYRETVEELPGDVEAAAKATGEWDDNLKQAGRDAISVSKEALTALADYVQGVHDATRQTVDSVVKGFETISRPTTDLMEKRSKLIQQQMELNRSTKDGEQKYQELQKQIDSLNESIDEYSTGGMKDALASQLAFMDEYIKNLEKAKQMGLSNELLASFSDGSVASAEYLASLVENPEQAAAVDALYQQVQEKKNQFTDALTEQKLTVDETYDAMVAKAQEAVDGLNLGQSAQDAMGATVAGLAQGIADHVPEVADAVDAILSELNRLNGYGISFSTGPMGVVNNAEMFNSLFNVPKHEVGLDYVPFDGYLASLHEGESILTAEENRIWQRFKNGAQPQTMDYDALGATMRDNVKPGGDVYLDGRVVGSVISKQQGNSFRALQRSGWQG